jgi:hypothetical protein
MFRFFEAILPIFYEDFLQKTFQIKNPFPVRRERISAGENYIFTIQERSTT